MSALDPKPTLRLTARAEQDSQDILLSTRRTWGARQRTIYRAAIERALHRLEDHPQLGQAQDDLFIGCRSLPMKSTSSPTTSRDRRRSSCSASSTSGRTPPTKSAHEDPVGEGDPKP